MRNPPKIPRKLRVQERPGETGVGGTFEERNDAETQRTCDAVEFGNLHERQNELAPLDAGGQDSTRATRSQPGKAGSNEMTQSEPNLERPF